MNNRVIADLYLDPPRNLFLQTGPGRGLNVNGGHARVTREEDMVPLLQREGVIIIPTDEWAERLPGWMKQCGEHKPPKATVTYQGQTVLLNGVPPEPPQPPKRGPGRPPKNPPKWGDDVLTLAELLPDDGDADNA